MNEKIPINGKALSKVRFYVWFRYRTFNPGSLHTFSQQIVTKVNNIIPDGDDNDR